MNKAKRILLLVLPLLLGSCANSYRVNLLPDPVPHTTKKIDLNAGLFIDEAQTRQGHTQGGSCLTGMGQQWSIETGGALRIGAERTFRKIFTDVEILNSMGEFKNKPLTLLVTPKIVEFYIRNLTATLSLHCKLVNQAGEMVYEKTIISTGVAQGATTALFSVWWSGILGAIPTQRAISEASHEAFNNAFVLLADDIVNKVDFSTYLKE